GLSGVSFTYNGSATAPINAGEYGVVASLNHPNYVAPPATGTLVINKATASIWLGDQISTYNGSPKAATASTNPLGVSGVLITYSGLTVVYSESPIAPTNVGSYALTATLTNPNYEPAYATGTLGILKATQAITFPPIATYQSIAKVSITPNATASSGLPVSLISLTPGQCTVSVNPTTLVSTVNLLAVGSCTIQASQGGTDNYYAASDVVQSFLIFNPNSTVSGRGTFNSTDPAGKATFSIAASYQRKNPTVMT